MLRDLGRKGKYLHGAGEFLSGIFGNQCLIIRELKIHKSDHSCLDPL